MRVAMVWFLLENQNMRERERERDLVKGRSGCEFIEKKTEW